MKTDLGVGAFPIMNEALHFHFEIDGDDFTSAGNASVRVKKLLRQIDLDQDTIRRVSVAMYEGEINMVIHANGGQADVYVEDDAVKVILADSGPGIPDIELAMSEGYSTASDVIRELGFGAGMGLPNMKRYSDQLDIQTAVGKGTTVTMIFKVND